MAGKLLFGGIVRQSLILSRLTPVAVASNCQQTKIFSTSQQRNLKEIVERSEGNTTIVEGRIIKSPRADSLLDPKSSPYPDACPLCKLQLDVQYTDILIISQFLAPDCTVLPQYVTKLCKKQHQKVRTLAYKALRAGLIKKFKDGKLVDAPYKYMKYNVYFKDRF